MVRQKRNRIILGPCRTRWNRRAPAQQNRRRSVSTSTICPRATNWNDPRAHILERSVDSSRTTHTPLFLLRPNLDGTEQNVIYESDVNE